MTLRINNPQEALYINTDRSIVIPFASLELQSQWDRKRETFSATPVDSTDRWAVYLVDFGDGFRNEHKNGVYWARFTTPGQSEGSWFLLKIITQPGGNDGMTRYVADADTEERVADTYYRPNY